MIRLLGYLLSKGVLTEKVKFPQLPDFVRGLPQLTEKACAESCNICSRLCPTDAIELNQHSEQVRDATKAKQQINLDLGKCINCSLCVEHCPTGTIVNRSDTKSASLNRERLLLSNQGAAAAGKTQLEDEEAADPRLQAESKSKLESKSIFKRSLAVRVVSTGCSACDLESSACGNPVFDMERFGVHLVASPRFADVLLVTGPVPKAMHEPLRRCYEAMAEPRLVIAAGTCAISGGVHKNGYAEANGVENVIPVDAFIPGCPPHPWSIIYGIHLLMSLS